jgi:hypothetical protein
MTSRDTGKRRGNAGALVAVIAIITGIAILLPAQSPSQQSAKQSAKGKPAPANGAASPASSASGAADAQNPFERYIAGTKANRPEAALARFGKSCGLDTGAAAPRFAERLGEHWKIVKNLDSALKDQEDADYFHTLEVWEAGKRVVTEEWGIEAESGDYYRVFSCLLGRQVTSAELVSWKLADEENSDEPGWGCEIRWELRAGGKFERTLTVFLDLREKPIVEPNMEAGERQDLDDQDFDKRTWVDLGYPPALLK